MIQPSMLIGTMRGLTRNGSVGVYPPKRNGKRPLGEPRAGDFRGGQRKEGELQIFMRETLRKNGRSQRRILRTEAFTAFMTWPEMCRSGPKRSTLRVANRSSVAETLVTRAQKSLGASSISLPRPRAIGSVSERLGFFRQCKKPDLFRPFERAPLSWTLEALGLKNEEQTTEQK